MIYAENITFTLCFLFLALFAVVRPPEKASFFNGIKGVMNNPYILVIAELLICRAFILSGLVQGEIIEEVLIYSILALIMFLFASLFQKVKSTVSIMYLICSMYYILTALECGIGVTSMFFMFSPYFSVLMTVLITCLTLGLNVNVEHILYRYGKRAANLGDSVSNIKTRKRAL